MFFKKNSDLKSALYTIFNNKKIFVLYLILFISFIIIWQYWFFKHSETMPDKFHIAGAVGGGGHVLESYQNFLFFYKKTGFFPVGTLKKIEKNDYYNYQEWLKKNSNSLVNEIHEVYRSGDRGKIYLLWFDSVFRSSPLDASYYYPGFILFTFSLIIFFLGFALNGKTLFATCCVILIGSNNFQLFEVYKSNNIFNIPISILLLALGLNAQWIIGNVSNIKIKYVLAIALTGLLIGFYRHVRGDIVVLLIPLLLLFVFNFKILFKQRILCAIILLFSFFIAQESLEYNFNYSFNEAKEFVKVNGGYPYEGNMYTYHKLWHPIFCGLGDFGKDKGYKWDDLTAYNYALPHVREKLGIPDLWKNFSLSNNPAGVLSSYYMDTYYDSNKIYKMKLEDFPIYSEVIRNKIITDIKSDPIWFIEIIWKRVKLFFTQTTGLDISFFGKFIHFESINFGWLIPVSLILAFLFKDYMYLKLIIMSMFLAATAILIYSGGNFRYYSIAHIFAFLYLAQRILKYSLVNVVNKVRSL